MTQTNTPYVIVVGIDYSTASELALERALELATAQPNGELHVVHVVSAFNVLSSEDAPNDQNTDMPAVDTLEYERLKTYVAASVQAFEREQNGKARRPMSVFSHLRALAPAHEIAQLASDLQADLVVVGMHGRGGVTRFLLGSVAENVTRLAPCPVLVVRPKGLAPEYPKIVPPCPQCVEARTKSGGKEYWCEQHRERHGQRHVYYQADRASQNTNLPMFVQE